MSLRDGAWLSLIALVFVAWHVPLEYRTAAGQDEDWYGMTGMAILRTGLPHIPYITSDDPGSVCYHADTALYTLPPLSFYAQALAHLALGEGLGPARLASTAAGLAAVLLVYALGMAWFDDRRGALMGAAVYAFSRPFLFPATTARPDMTATALGLLAVWWSVRHERDPCLRFLAASGAAAGLCLLAHPFGVVPATQIGLRLLGRPVCFSRRVRDALIFAGVALGALGLWLPLIALHPDLFRSQFIGNVFRGAAARGRPGSIAVLGAFGFQARQLWDLLMLPQAALYILGLAWGLTQARTSQRAAGFRYHLGAGLLLLILFEGRHPTLGYYAYPAATASLAVGMMASAAAGVAVGRFPGRWESRRRSAANGLVLVVLTAALLPGAGLRTLIAHLRHWDDPGYNARALARSVTADIPAGAVTAVDPAYVIDFHLAGCPVVDAFIEPDPRIRLYDVRNRFFDYAVFGPSGIKVVLPRMDNLMLVKTYGDPRDPFACYAELYRRPAVTDQPPLRYKEASPGSPCGGERTGP